MRLSPSGQDGVTRMAFSTLPEKILKIDKLYERVCFSRQWTADNSQRQVHRNFWGSRYVHYIDYVISKICRDVKTCQTAHLKVQFIVCQLYLKNWCNIFIHNKVNLLSHVIRCPKIDHQLNQYSNIKIALDNCKLHFSLY